MRQKRASPRLCFSSRKEVLIDGSRDCMLPTIFYPVIRERDSSVRPRRRTAYLIMRTPQVHYYNVIEGFLG